MKCKYVFMFPLKNLAHKGLITNTALQLPGGYLSTKSLMHVSVTRSPYVK